VRHVPNAWVKLKNIKAKTTYAAMACGLLAGSGGLSMVMLGTASAAPTTLVNVTNVQKQGWFFLDDNGNGGSGEFVNGPAGSGLKGTGSVELGVTATNQGYLFGKAAWGGTKLSDIKKLNYNTYVTTGNNTTAPALQIDVDANVNDNDNSYQGRLVYEPYLTHSVTDGSWQTWNPLDNSTSDNTHGNWWFSNGTLASQTGCAIGTPCTWKTVLQQLPHAGVNSAAPLVGFKAGSGWSSFQGNVDDFTIGVGSKTTEYNFDYQACTPVNTTKGPLTAALVGGNVSGDVDASGCDIGVYYSHANPGQVNNAQIHDANQYGVFVDGGNGNVNANVSKSHVYAVGNHDANSSYAPNGVQTGVGVYYDTLSDAGVATPGKATGNINGNTIEKYQKNGVAVNGSKSDVDVSNNVVVGAGPVNYIAQNGVEFARGGTGSANGNTVSSNAYTGANEATSAGVLVFGGDGTPLVTNVNVGNNKLIDNDVAINFANYDSGGTGAATSPTKNTANNNWIFSSRVTNVTGLPIKPSGAVGYQAGIEDAGNHDSACGNTILGPGYTDQGSYDATAQTAVPGSDNAVVRDVDAGYTFPTIGFSVCHSSSNYGGGNFGPGFFKSYGQKFNHNWWF
jgi:hypothetical protein